MSLSDSQKSIISTWIAEGKSLADVQRLLREELSISMTYMDVRFLIDDLDIVFVEPESAEADTTTVEEPEVVGDHTNRGMTIDMDVVMRPGAYVSGKVTFSDGETLSWELSSAGKLGLVPVNNSEYHPSPEDMQKFSKQLQDILQKKGYQLIMRPFALGELPRWKM